MEEGLDYKKILRNCLGRCLVIVFINVTQARVTGKEGASAEEMLASGWRVGMSVGAFC